MYRSRHERADGEVAAAPDEVRHQHVDELGAAADQERDTLPDGLGLAGGRPLSQHGALGGP